MNQPLKILRLILGDQLNPDHPWFQTESPQVSYLLMEIRQETDYVQHHIQKVIGFFAAMRNFKKELEQKGHRVIYLTLDDPDNTQNLNDNVRNLIKQEDFNRFEYQYPDEYRLDLQLERLCEELPVLTRATDSHHFLTDRFEVKEFFKNKKKSW